MQLFSGQEGRSSVIDCHLFTALQECVEYGAAKARVRHQSLEAPESGPERIFSEAWACASSA